ncbi:hypothetical protein NM208_g1047 [Fusarium decemcellulare]|uniref:Uncharacterized protein n=1 Tax=Fusarium decemcellulare TaxID=57161 RepID=A0ACC1SXG5_9HYPO|nr:hypothetical protein NM208_g1047 [Fusarium decemcellulare]
MPSRTLLTLLVFLPCSVQALFGSSNETDFWDDFANNFATDLAPIISLFGEQVTKQFLSESTTILDTIIFAVGPLGIITAIVSCIRVSGSSFLKSVVGRAREPHGVPEIELCSSTSESVCELWSNGGICRVFGRPKILEFIFCKPDEEDFYAVYDDEGGEERPATCGVFLNRDELKRALNPSVGSDPLGQENTATSSRTSRSGWKAVSSRETLFSKWLPWKFVHETSGSGSLRTTNATETAETATPPSWLADVLARAIGRTGSNTSYYEAPPSSLDIESGNMNHSNEEVEETKAPGDEDHRQFAPFPNLALNIGVQEAPISIWILWLGSVFGVLLQSSFFGYATWATWYHPAFYEGGKVPNTPPLFFTFTMVGTTFIVLGMGLCATIIDRSSKDQRFVPLCPKGTENLGRRIFWFQPAQHIGDQEFAAFLCNERKKEYVASWNDKTVPTSTLPVWLGVGLSFVGWVVQFIGLRGQHATVSLYQLGCTIIMSIIRASIRASRSAPKNQLENPSKGLQGHELDWQALRLASECLHQEGPGVNSDQEDKRRSFRSQIRHWFGGQIHRSSSAQETKSNSLDPTKPELLFDTDIEDELKEKVHWVIDSFQSERICERSTDYARMKIRKNLAVVIRSDRDWAERTRKLVWCIESCDLELQEILTKLEDGKSTPGSPNMATKWIRIRARLAHLTKRLRPYQSWEDDTRKVALQLKAVLEKSSELLYPHPDSSWRQTTTLVWSMSFRLWVDEASTVQEMPICFFMVRTGKVWNIDENQLVAVLSVWSWAVARYISSLNRDPDEWFSTQQRKTVAGKIEELHFIRRVLGLWDEFEDISPLFDSGRFVRTNLSVPSMTSGLGGIISRSELMPEPDYRVGCWSIPGTSSLMQLMAQDLFTTFIETVGTLRLGYLEDVTILNTGRSENKKIIENMVRLLASEGLATRKEAIMSVIPALCPRHETLESPFNIRQRALVFLYGTYRSELRWMMSQRQTFTNGECLNRSRQVSDKVPGSGQRYDDSQLWQVHIDVIYWLLWSKRVTQTFDYGPKFPFKDSSVLRKLQPPFEARALLDEKTLDDLKLDNVVPGDTKSQRDAFEQALTLDQRFKLGESEPEVRKQLLRWAIEWDCTDLIEDLWYAERNRPWVESAFSSGCDELFWAVSLRSHTHDMINTILVLLEVVEIDLSAPLKCRDDMDQSWWAASRKRDLIKRQYEQGHNVLGAAFANPNGLEVAALLLDKRSWSYDLASEDICKTVSAAIQYGSLEIVDGLMTKVVEKECDCGDGMFELLLLLVQWGLADWVKHMLQTHERFLAGPMCLDSALRVAKDPDYLMKKRKKW